jgi:hypothetical protein
VITRRSLVITPRGFYGGTAVLVVLGLGLRLAPTRLPEAGEAATVPAATQAIEAMASSADAGVYAPITTGNVFSQTRTPPTVRFVPEGRSAPAPAEPSRPKVRQPVFRLFGITLGAEGAIALIEANPKIAGAELYRLGDSVGGFLITAITESTVVIGRAGGPLVLRLTPGERRPR